MVSCCHYSYCVRRRRRGGREKMGRLSCVTIILHCPTGLQSMSLGWGDIGSWVRTRLLSNSRSWRWGTQGGETVSAGSQKGWEPEGLGARMSCMFSAGLSKAWFIPLSIVGGRERITWGEKCLVWTCFTVECCHYSWSPFVSKQHIPLQCATMHHHTKYGHLFTATNNDICLQTLVFSFISVGCWHSINKHTMSVILNEAILYTNYRMTAFTYENIQAVWNVCVAEWLHALGMVVNNYIQWADVIVGRFVRYQHR